MSEMETREVSSLNLLSMLGLLYCYSGSESAAIDMHLENHKVEKLMR